MSTYGHKLLTLFPQIIRKHQIKIDQSFLELFGDFVSVDILLEVEEFITNEFTFIMVTDDHTIMLKYHSRQEPSKQVLDRLANRIALLLTFTKKKGELKLNIWECETKKKLPQLPNKTLGVREVNSGCTKFSFMSDNMGEITIWRNEELGKVLLHELIHSLGLDFFRYPPRFNNILKKHFNIPTSIEIRLGESYVEMWANLINSILVSYVPSGVKNIELFFENLSYEFLFSVFQCTKILKFYGFNCFNDCRHSFKNKENIEKFQQNSSILSYYIIKTMFFQNLDNFIKFCSFHNRQLLCFQKIKFTQFFALLNKTINNTDFYTLMDKTIPVINTNTVSLQQSLRMTLLG